MGMRVDAGDIVHLRQYGEEGREFLRARVTKVLPGVNNADWQGFYYQPIDESGREIGPQLFAYTYSVARREPTPPAPAGVDRRGA